MIFDDSCEEILNDKKFVKIATSGLHRKLHVICVKRNLFHQSKLSRTIDLNTTHIVLFKSLRDIQQIEYLGKQLNCPQLLTEAYKFATAEPYGHLVIGLDHKTTKVSHRTLFIEPRWTQTNDLLHSFAGNRYNTISKWKKIAYAKALVR